MTPHLGTLPDGARGFDADVVVSGEDAKRFYAAGYRFAVRYVRRGPRHAFDLSVAELVALLGAGLGVMVVQHVASVPGGWLPSLSVGESYGKIAAEEARVLGLPPGVTVWCDLEDVSPHAAPEAVIAFCNAWHTAVQDALYAPGLYVGDACGLTATELYRALRFTHYWSAYNLNRDNYPIVRGVQMRQKPYPAPASRVPGIAFEYDEDIIAADLRGGTPVLLLP